MPDVIEVQPRAGTLEPGEEEPEMEKGAVAAVDGAIQKDEKGKLTNESWKQVWQHFLKNRPLQDETNGVPLGFELEEDGKTVVCDPDTGKPKTTWASIQYVLLLDLASLDTTSIKPIGAFRSPVSSASSQPHSPRRVQRPGVRTGPHLPLHAHRRRLLLLHVLPHHDRLDRTAGRPPQVLLSSSLSLFDLLN